MVAWKDGWPDGSMYAYMCLYHAVICCNFVLLFVQLQDMEVMVSQISLQAYQNFG